MTLLTPALAIAGICAVAIPILIHLLMRQRRKPIEFAAMRFLIEAFRKHKRRLQLEQLILLATRCLILALLGVALARPLLNAAGIIQNTGGRTVTLIIDNGLASSAIGAGTQSSTSLAGHIDQAISIVRALAPGDSVSVITAARPAAALLSPPSTDHAAVIDLLRSIEAAQSPTDLHSSMNHVREAAAQARQLSRPALVYLLSDFRAGSASLDSPLPATQADVEGTSVQLLASPAASSSITNIQVAAIEPVRSVIIPNAGDGSDQIRVRLRRTGSDLPADVSRVRLLAESLPPLAVRTVRWQPGQVQAEVDFTLDLGAGNDRTVSVTASLLDDDALAADNTRHAILDLRSQIRVLLIDRRSFGFERSLDQLTAGQWMRRALEPVPSADQSLRRPAASDSTTASSAMVSPIAVVEAEPAALDIADLRTADVAIVPRPDLINERGWQLLRGFVDRGGLVFVTPPGELAVHPWTVSFTTAMSLAWSLALEPIAAGEAVTDDGAEPMALAIEQPRSEMLRMILNDLQDMARAVQVYRMLPIDVASTSVRRTTPAGSAATPPDAGQGEAGSVTSAAATQAAAATTLLRFADGSPMLVMGSPSHDESNAAATGSQGLVIYMAVSPEVAWTNLPTKPLMVPLLHEIVRQGMSMIRASQVSEVGEQPTLVQAGPAARDVTSPDGEVIPLQRGRPQQPLKTSGVYSITDASNQPLGMLAVNVDPQAGVTDAQSAAAVGAWLNRSGPWQTFDPASIGVALGMGGGGSPLAGILLAIVLVLVLLETMLARWFSHAYRQEGDDEGRLSIRASLSQIRRVAVATSVLAKPAGTPAGPPAGGESS